MLERCYGSLLFDIQQGPSQIHIMLKAKYRSGGEHPIIFFFFPPSSFWTEEPTIEVTTQRASTVFTALSQVNNNLLSPWQQSSERDSVEGLGFLIKAQQLVSTFFVLLTGVQVQTVERYAARQQPTKVRFCAADPHSRKNRNCARLIFLSFLES